MFVGVGAGGVNTVCVGVAVFVLCCAHFVIVVVGGVRFDVGVNAVEWQ